MPYSSKVDIKLGQQPKSADPKFYEDALDLYNACHILNARLEAIQNGITSGDEDVPPWEAMPFTRWFWATAWEDIKAGQVVTIVRGRFRDEDNRRWIEVEGMVKGAPFPGGPNFSSPTNSGKGIDSMGIGIFGICLDEVSAGERARFGVGPAILNVPGIKRGDLVLSPTFTYGMQSQGLGQVQMQNSDYRGSLLRTYIIQIPSVVVGSGVDTDAVLITPVVDYYAQVNAEYGKNQASIPAGSSN